MSSGTACKLPNCDCRGFCQMAGMRVPVAGQSQTLAHHNGKPCPYCDEPMDLDHPTRVPTREHCWPRSRGGPDNAYNIVPTCWRCNQHKGDRTVEEFHRHLVETNDSRATAVAKFMRSRRPQVASTQVKPLIEALAREAQDRADKMGLDVAVCIVVVHDGHARAHTSPFEAESIEGIAVAHQLREQSDVLWRQAQPIAEAAE